MPDHDGQRELHAHRAHHAHRTHALCTRRTACARVLALTGLLALPALLSGCGEEKGPVPVRYDRDVCEICNMIISDPRFAAEIRAPDGKVHKFDDIGDAIHWLHRQDWFKNGQQPKEFWVMNYHDGKTWLDARKAWYLPGVISPMDYGFGAVPQKEPGAISYEEMERRVLAKGLSSRCTIPGQNAGDGHEHRHQHGAMMQEMGRKGKKP